MKFADAMNEVRARLADAEFALADERKMAEDERLEHENYLRGIEAIFGTTKLRELKESAKLRRIPKLHDHCPEGAAQTPRRAELHERDVQEFSLGGIRATEPVVATGPALARPPFTYIPGGAPKAAA